MFTAFLIWWNSLGKTTKLLIISAVLLPIVLLFITFTVLLDVSTMNTDVYSSNYTIQSKTNFAKKYEVLQNSINSENSADDKTGNATDKVEGYDYPQPEYLPAVPYFYQSDPQWNTVPLRNNCTVSDSGCGLTSCAMLATYELGYLVKPIDVYNAVPASDFITSMGHSLPNHFWEPYGYTVETLTLDGASISESDYQALYDCLSDGYVAMLSAKPSKYTKSGHILAAYAAGENGGIYLHDPNQSHREFSTVEQTKQEIMSSIKKIWLIRRPS